jgi:phenylalanyl-tRNA synthetase beta chain
MDGERVGVIGTVDAKTCNTFELSAPAQVVELKLKPIEARAQLQPVLVTLADTPAMVRDFAFVLDESVRWADLDATARSAAGPLLEQLAMVDLYRGAQVPPGKKSIAIRLIYRDPVRTLTRDEVDQYQESVRHAVATKLGGTLRA